MILKFRESTISKLEGKGDPLKDEKMAKIMELNEINKSLEQKVWLRPALTVQTKVCFQAQLQEHGPVVLDSDQFASKRSNSLIRRANNSLLTILMLYFNLQLDCTHILPIQSKGRSGRVHETNIVFWRQV